MKKKSLLIFFLMFAAIYSSSTGNFKDKEGIKQNQISKNPNSVNISGKNGDMYRLNINNFNLPINNKGILAAVNIPPANQGAGGRYANEIVLFSSGFLMSGYSDTTLWANGVASASLIEDYEPGTYEFGENDSLNVIYVVKKTDPAFSQSWQDWKDAVILGADFYDGDGDSLYNPVDKNNNGLWDTNEDMPDLLGDETVWCVFKDSRTSSERRFTNVNSQGIEIRQTVFAYAGRSVPAGNIIYIRYRIRNSGTANDTLKDVYFGIWADPDLGDYTDDLVGYDIGLKSGYVYNYGSDNTYGNNPPVFLINHLAGPAKFTSGETFTDTNENGIFDEGEPALDTAYSIRGQILGIRSIPGAKNLDVSSFVHYQQGTPPIQDPNNEIEARYYMEGKTQEGATINPCTWPLGEVKAVDCATVDNKFWYSGDPVSCRGWLNSRASDQRFMQNSGPFNLPKGKEGEVEIVVAYIVGQGTSPLSGIAEAKKYARAVTGFYKSNFTNMVVSVAREENSVPKEFTLDQNYPNPFNPSTAISYQLSAQSKVELKIFDVLGREVQTLVKEIQSAGNYKVNFDATSLPSGIYIYQIKADNFIQSKKMILIK